MDTNVLVIHPPAAAAEASDAKDKIRGSSKWLGFILLHRECLHNISLQPICRHLDATSAHPRLHTSDMSLLIFLRISLLHYRLSVCAGVHMCDSNVTTHVPELLPHTEDTFLTPAWADVEGCSSILEHQRPHLTWEQLFHWPCISWCSTITPVQAVKRQPSSWSRLFWVWLHQDAPLKLIFLYLPGVMRSGPYREFGDFNNLRGKEK